MPATSLYRMWIASRAACACVPFSSASRSTGARSGLPEPARRAIRIGRIQYSAELRQERPLRRRSTRGREIRSRQPIADRSRNATRCSGISCPCPVLRATASRFCADHCWSYTSSIARSTRCARSGQGSRPDDRQDVLPIQNPRPPWRWRNGRSLSRIR